MTKIALKISSGRWGESTANCVCQQGASTILMTSRAECAEIACFCDCNCEFPPQAGNRCDFWPLSNKETLRFKGVNFHRFCDCNLILRISSDNRALSAKFDCNLALAMQSAAILERVTKQKPWPSTQQNSDLNVTICVLDICLDFIRRVKVSLDPDTFESIAIHLLCLLRCFCKKKKKHSSWLKAAYAPPTCVTIRL